MSGLFFILPLLAAAFLSHALPHRWVRPFLTLVGLVFVGSYGLVGLVVLLAVGLAAWGAAGMLLRPVFTRRRAFILAVVVVLILPLLLAKNYLEASTLVSALLTGLGITASTLPAAAFSIAGLSFFTFRALAFVLDAYHGRLAARPSLGDAFLYFFFFPQFLAGPIERPIRFFNTFHKPRSISYRQLVDGLILIAFGVFMKVAVADRMALFTDAVYNDPAGAGMLRSWMALYFYAIQLYCDFSGYTNIAIGICLVLGFESAVNFRQPYMAVSIADFWTRWHISLSFWLRDYIFLPVAYIASRRLGDLIAKRSVRDMASYAITALITMALCGVWHGSALTFLLWGVLHAVFLIASRLTKSARNRIWKTLGFAVGHPLRRIVAILVTFHLVAFAWVLFRAETVNTVYLFFSGLFTPASMAHTFKETQSTIDLFWSAIFLVIIAFVQILQERRNALTSLASSPLVVRWVLYIILLLAIEAFSVFDGATRFAYVVF